MNIFQELNKLPKIGINEVSYGTVDARLDRILRHEGKTYQEWAKEFGVTVQCIYWRIKKYGDPYPRVIGSRTPAGHLTISENLL
jgi:DNA invertase Pin-like site-specific DNA recombinase